MADQELRTPRARSDATSFETDSLRRDSPFISSIDESDAPLVLASARPLAAGIKSPFLLSGSPNHIRFCRCLITFKVAVAAREREP